ncbi:hypothetical protein Agub_g2636, partial [Astrephomene gubernaculifera]
GGAATTEGAPAATAATAATEAPGGGPAGGDSAAAAGGPAAGPAAAAAATAGNNSGAGSGQEGTAAAAGAGGEGGGEGAAGGEGGGSVVPLMLDPATLCAIRATLQRAGLNPAHMSDLLASHGLGLASDVEPEVVCRVAQALASAGFDTGVIVSFLFPPDWEELAALAAAMAAGGGDTSTTGGAGGWLLSAGSGGSVGAGSPAAAAAAAATAAAAAAGGLLLGRPGPSATPLSEVQLEAMRVALAAAGVEEEAVAAVHTWSADVRAIQTVSSALEAGGFTPLEVARFIAPAASAALIDALGRRGITPAAAAALLRPDGCGLARDLDPQELADAAAAMATAGFTAPQMVRAIGADEAALPPLEPAGLSSCHEALLAEGFSPDELAEAVLAEGGAGVRDEIGAGTVARVVAALAQGGLDSDAIRRFLRYDVVRAARAPLQPAALTAMQAVVQGAGLLGEAGEGAGAGAGGPEGRGVSARGAAAAVAAAPGAAPAAAPAQQQGEAVAPEGPQQQQGEAAGEEGAAAAAPAAGEGGGSKAAAGGGGAEEEAASATAAAAAVAAAAMARAAAAAVGPAAAAAAAGGMRGVSGRVLGGGVRREASASVPLAAPPPPPVLLPDGSGVSPEAGPGLVAQIGSALVEAMFKPAQIRAFLMPPAASFSASAPHHHLPDPASSSSAIPTPAGTGDGTQPSSRHPPLGARSHLSPRDVVVFRAVLAASGFSAQELMELVRADGRGVDPEAEAELVARAVAALAAAGFRGSEVQLFLELRDPAPALTPAEAAAARAALASGGFTQLQLESLLRWDGLGLVSEQRQQQQQQQLSASQVEMEGAGGAGLGGAAPSPHVMAQVAVVLAGAGFPAFHICQYLSPKLPPLPPHIVAVGRRYELPTESSSSTLRPIASESVSDIPPRSSDASCAATAGREDSQLAPGMEPSGFSMRDEVGDNGPYAAPSLSLLPPPPPSISAVSAARDGPLSRLSLPPATLAAMRAAVSRRCKALSVKQMRQIAPHLGKHATSGAAAKAAAAAAAAATAKPVTDALTAAAAAAGDAGESVTAPPPPPPPPPPPAAASSWLPSDPEVTTRVVRALSAEGFSPDHIRRFFLQPAVTAAVAAAEVAVAAALPPEIDDEYFAAAEVAAFVDDALAAMIESLDHVTPPLLVLIKALLKSSGFTAQHLSNLLSADRRRLDPDWDAESAAMLVAALAAGGWSARFIRLMLTTGPPVPALTPNELGSLNDALLDAGFSRRQLRLLLRTDCSGPGAELDSTCLAQMAAALAQANFTAGQLCQFLGPPPTSAAANAPAAPPPPPLLSPLLAALNATNITASSSANNAASNTAAGGNSTAPANTSNGNGNGNGSLTANTVGGGAAGSGWGALQGPGAGGMSMAAAASAAGASAASGGVSLLDVRSMMDIRNVAASCGISSRTLVEMVRPDGRGLLPHADPRVIERVGQHMANQGFTPSQVQRFLLPHGGCGYGSFDHPTAAAVRAVLLAAGFTPADLKASLASSSTTLNPAVPPGTLAAMSYALAAAGATADQIRHFLRPPPAAASAGMGAVPPAAVLAAQVREALTASGYAAEQLVRIVRQDGTALRADTGPLRLAQVVAALAAAEVSAAAIRVFVRPLGGVSPSMALSLRAALERVGWSRERIMEAFSADGNELRPDIDPATLAEVALELSSAGVNGDIIRQLFALAGGTAALAAPSPEQQQQQQQLQSLQQQQHQPPWALSAAGAGTAGAAAGGAAIGTVSSMPISSVGSVPSVLSGVAIGGGTLPEPATGSTGLAIGGGGGAGARRGGSMHASGHNAAGGGGGFPPQLLAKLAAMKEAIVGAQGRPEGRSSATALPAVANVKHLEAFDVHDTAKMIVLLAQAGFSAEDIRAFLSMDPRILAAPNFPSFLGGAVGGGSAANTATAAAAPGAGLGGLGGPLTVGAMRAQRRSDPGLSRSNTMRDRVPPASPLLPSARNLTPTPLLQERSSARLISVLAAGGSALLSSALSISSVAPCDPATNSSNPPDGSGARQRSESPSPAAGGGGGGGGDGRGSSSRSPLGTTTAALPLEVRGSGRRQTGTGGGDAGGGGSGGGGV